MSQSANTFIPQLCVDTGCSLKDLPGAMRERERQRQRDRDRERGYFMLSVRLRDHDYYDH